MMGALTEQGRLTLDDDAAMAAGDRGRSPCCGVLLCLAFQGRPVVGELVAAVERRFYGPQNSEEGGGSHALNWPAFFLDPSNGGETESVRHADLFWGPRLDGHVHVNPEGAHP